MHVHTPALSAAATRAMAVLCVPVTCTRLHGHAEALVQRHGAAAGDRLLQAVDQACAHDVYD